MNKMFYTGIGSRSTPKRVLDYMHNIAIQMEDLGWWLRSGGADGADLAFEAGAGIKKEIYIPWPGFNGNPSKLYHLSPQAMDIASCAHPDWIRCSTPVKKLMTRNVHQILGGGLNEPSKFVVCWTSDGATRYTTGATGGTGQAIRVAVMHRIPVYNLNDAHSTQRFIKLMERLKAK